MTSWEKTLALIWQTERAKVRPVERITPSVWAKKRLGFRFDDHPWEVEMIDTALSPDVRKSVWIGASQVMGKTHAGNAIIGYHVDHDPCGNMVLQPDQDRADKWMLNKFTPMSRMKCFRDKLNCGTRNSSGNTIKYKVFPGGFVSVGGAGTPQGLAGDSAKVLWADEIDRYKVTVGKEGDPLDLFWNRAGAFYDAIKIESSTPTIRGLSRIETDFEGSDKRYWHVDCPFCGHSQHLKWSQLDWGERKRGTLEEPLYVCENRDCDSTWTDAQRCEAIRNGRWKATAPFRGIAGFHLNGIYSLRRAQRGYQNRMQEMVDKYLLAKRKGRETLKVWINTFLAEGSVEDIEVIDPSDVNNRNEKYEADMPTKVLLLTFGGDVQKDRIEVELVGHAKDNETWGIECRKFHGNTSGPKPWKEMEEWWGQTRQREDGAILKIACGLLDSGHVPNYVYDWCQKNRFRNVWPCKGSSTPGEPLVKYSQTRRGLVLVGTESAKDEIYNSLTIKDPGPGYSHFGYRVEADDLGYDEEFFAQLCAEQVEITYHLGKRVRRFINPHQRPNEALDKRVYALAAKEMLNPNWEALAKNVRMVANEPTMSQDAPQQPKATLPHPAHTGAPYQLRRPPSPRGGGWAKKW